MDGTSYAYRDHGERVAHKSRSRRCNGNNPRGVDLQKLGNQAVEDDVRAGRVGVAAQRVGFALDFDVGAPQEDVRQRQVLLGNGCGGKPLAGRPLRGRVGVGDRDAAARCRAILGAGVGDVVHAPPELCERGVQNHFGHDAIVSSPKMRQPFVPHGDNVTIIMPEPAKEAGIRAGFNMSSIEFESVFVFVTWYIRVRQKPAHLSRGAVLGTFRV